MFALCFVMLIGDKGGGLGGIGRVRTHIIIAYIQLNWSKRPYFSLVVPN